MFFSGSAWYDCHSIAIDYNIAKNYLIWSVDSQNAIFVARLYRNRASIIDSENPVVLLNTTHRIDKIAIDWIKDRLFILSNSFIEYFDILSRLPGDVITSNPFEFNRKPTMMALNPLDSFLVWRLVIS